ncbi:MAG: hypothetical protein NC299_17375 [Lachnospiraceae bacterium]|nr:hypothetical protein [Lachnospiraceae bacterium]
MLKKVLAAAEWHDLPMIEQAVTLEKCMDYYGIMEYFMYPSLDDLKQQTEFYDGEITKLTEQIAESQNIGALHQKQIDGITAA